MASPFRVFKPFANPARGSSAGTMSEMPPSFAPEFPFNDAKETASGHLLEFDDTPGAERVQITHRTGTHVEMRPDGSVKYKSTKNRQDVTIGDHEVIIQGDFNITVDGGSKILVRNGSLEIQSNFGAAVNVKGEMKLHADNILLQAKNKISLNAPFVDIGGGAGIPPYMTLPVGMVPVFGVPVPVMTGMMSGIPKPPGLPAAGGTLLSLGTAVTAIASQVTAIAAYAQNLGKARALVASLRDSSGEPLVPQIEQPDEIPLSNPRLYSGLAVQQVQLRDRQFDSPDDVGTDLYTTHLGLCEELKDFTAEEKDLPGQVSLDDTTEVPVEPAVETAFALYEGTVACETGTKIVTGTSTKFLTEVSPKQTITIAGVRGVVSVVVDDLTLILTDAWAGQTVTGAKLFVHMLRPFSEFMDRHSYPLSTRLGNSSLSLADMLTNYIPPTIEKDTSSTLPISTPQTPSSPLGGGSDSAPSGPRESYTPEAF